MGKMEHLRQRLLWPFCLTLLAGGAAVAAAAALYVEPAPTQPFRIHWVLLAVGFALAEWFTVDLDVRRQAQTLTFTEVPLTLGLVLAAPADLVVVRVIVGVAAVALIRRSPPIKVVFNAGQFCLQTGLAIFVFDAVLGSATAVEPRGWAAATLGVVASYLFSAAAVSLVMVLAGSPLDLRSQALVVSVGLIAAIASAATALGAAAVLWQEGHAWVLLLVIGAALSFFGLSYVGIRDRHRALAVLNTYATKMIAAGDVEDVLVAASDGLADLLHARRIVVVVPQPTGALFHELHEGTHATTAGSATAQEWDTALQMAQRPGLSWPNGMPLLGVAPAGEDVIVRPLPLPNKPGIILVDGRLSAARAFDDEDVQLLETAAGHAASALHNAQLVERLREEAAFRAHQALHDDITDLPNQRALIERLDEQLSHGVRLVMLTLRIHSLREVNETLGRAMGDEMLRKVAERITLIDRSWCARSGTDEFTVVVPGGQDDADVVARQLVDAFDQPVLCNDVALAVTVGIGVALAPQHGVEAEMLVRRASLAASRSAIEGTTVTTWDADRDPYDPQRLTIAADLRDAIPAGELEVQFQPQVDMKTGEVTGAEALVRWAHPRLGQLRPDQFIAAAEHTGAIDALTYHVLTVSLETGQRWRDRGWDLEMAVNLSARNLTNARFAAEVAAILERTGFPAESLTLELTESSVMTEAGRALATLDELSMLGVSLSIDDFGTGYSSLAHLRRLPVNEIKIDKSFVFDLTTNESDEAIVRSMVELGHTLSLRVVVEGVETVEVRDRLEKIGSDRLQGYLVSRPLTAAAFEHWMQERRVRASLESTSRVVHFQSRR